MHAPLTCPSSSQLSVVPSAAQIHKFIAFIFMVHLQNFSPHLYQAGSHQDDHSILHLWGEKSRVAG